MTLIKGSFEKTVQALKNLVAADIKVNLKTPITKLNQNELFEIRDLAAGLGLTATFDAVITPKDDGDLDPLALRADDEFLEKYWGEWYADLHGGKLPPRANHCASDGIFPLRIGPGGLHHRPLREHPALRGIPALGRQYPGNRRPGGRSGSSPRC